MLLLVVSGCDIGLYVKYLANRGAAAPSLLQDSGAVHRDREGQDTGLR